MKRALLALADCIIVPLALWLSFSLRLGEFFLPRGVTFNEDCPDLRNTRVVDIIDELEKYDIQADVYDPWVNVEEAK